MPSQSFMPCRGIDNIQRVTTQGFISSSHGYSSIKLAQHYIRPDGNSDQYRKGGYHA